MSNRRKSLTPSKVNQLIDGDSDSDSGTEKTDKDKDKDDSLSSSDDSQIVSPPSTTASQHPASRKPMSQLPPVPATDWAKIPAKIPADKVAEVRPLRLCGSEIGPKPTSSSGAAKIPVVNLADETRTSKRDPPQSESLLKSGPRREVFVPGGLGAVMKNKKPLIKPPHKKRRRSPSPLAIYAKPKQSKRGRSPSASPKHTKSKRSRSSPSMRSRSRINYSDEETEDDDVQDKHYTLPVRVPNLPVRTEKDTSDSSSDSDSPPSPATETLESRALAVARTLAERNLPTPHPEDNTGSGSVVWKYFNKLIKRDAKGNFLVQVGVCQIRNPQVTGAKCGVEIQMPGKNTAGCRQHIERKHKPQWLEYKAIDTVRKQAKGAVKKSVKEIVAVVEGNIYKHLLSYYLLFTNLN